MAYHLLRQVAVDYCAAVIYGLCHRVGVFFSPLFCLKTNKDNSICSGFFALTAPPPPHTHTFSILWWTISNKSQLLVFLSPFLCCSFDTLSTSLVSKDGVGEGRQRKRRTNVSTWTLTEGLSELWFRQTTDLQARCLRKGELDLNKLHVEVKRKLFQFAIQVNVLTFSNNTQNIPEVVTDKTK